MTCKRRNKSICEYSVYHMSDLGSRSECAMPLRGSVIKFVLKFTCRSNGTETGKYTDRRRETQDTMSHLVTDILDSRSA